MAFHRSIRSRKARRKINKGFDLQLTSMLDVLVIILVFLLKSQAASTHSFTSLPGMQLPYSDAPGVPVDSHHLIISPEALTFENETVLEFQLAEGSTEEEPVLIFNRGDLDEGGSRIRPLYDALIKAREQAELLRAKSGVRDEEGNPLPFQGIIAIQVDKRISYSVLRKVLYTAGSAGYKVFQFLAMRREG